MQFEVNYAKQQGRANVKKRVLIGSKLEISTCSYLRLVFIKKKVELERRGQWLRKTKGSWKLRMDAGGED